MCDTFTNSYQFFEEIGRGRFGTISRCFSLARSDFFAVKVVDRRDLLDATDLECLENEAKIMNLVSPHPNIVSIVDVFDKDSDYLSIVMELCDSYTLFDRIAARVVMSETEAAAYVKQLLIAVAHCHRLGVVHRDIKPENVMFDSRGTLKLGDFGSAVWMCGEEAEEATGIVGTPYYVAPEVLMGKDYGDKVDVWSCGVILYIMLSGIPPFYGDSATEIFESVLRGNLRFPPRLFRSVSAPAKDLLRKMMCKDVSRRLSAEQALRHPWIVNGGATSPMSE